jgi:hypothetical protein
MACKPHCKGSCTPNAWQKHETVYFIDHALKELERRNIPLQVVTEALQQPDQIVPNLEGRKPITSWSR